ncbi:MAG TPA: hypothetical protein VN636_19985 [Acidimicrobiia bacterium]|nr:hypothetical protein [Acidimicrobiia bacterium]
MNDYDYGDLAQFADSDITSLTPEQMGLDVTASSCLADCWRQFEECRNSQDGNYCLAMLNYCRMNCPDAG